MRLTKNILLIAWLIPIILGLIALYEYIVAINRLLVKGIGVTPFIYTEMLVTAVALFLAFIVYWTVMMYLIYLLQENLILLDAHLEKAADLGAKHLQESKSLLNQVLTILKRYEEVGKTS